MFLAAGPGSLFTSPGYLQYGNLATRELNGPGVFLVLAAKAPATVFKLLRSARGRIVNIEKKTEYVYHDSFHILDSDWGHVTIKMSGHPPFAPQVNLNGYEYVAAQARAAGIGFVEEGNCFTGIADPQGLAAVAVPCRIRRL